MESCVCLEWSACDELLWPHLTFWPLCLFCEAWIFLVETDQKGNIYTTLLPCPELNILVKGHECEYVTHRNGRYMITKWSFFSNLQVLVRFWNLMCPKVMFLVKIKCHWGWRSTCLTLLLLLYKIILKVRNHSALGLLFIKCTLRARDERPYHKWMTNVL